MNEWIYFKKSQIRLSIISRIMEMKYYYKSIIWKSHTFNTVMVEKEFRIGIRNRLTVAYTFKSITLRKCDI